MTTPLRTLVERRSRFLMLVALLHGHGAEPVAGALGEAVTALPDRLRRSVTWDQGKEMAQHTRCRSAASVSSVTAIASERPSA